jgi:hypothetical protein
LLDYESKIIAFEKELTNKPSCKMDPLELLPPEIISSAGSPFADVAGSNDFVRLGP